MSASVPAGQPTPAIICVLGTARSGSTLLQRMVELNSNAIGLGEISRVQELLERDSRCACGERLAACTFWASALDDLRQTAPLVTWSKASWPERGRPLRGVLAAMTGTSLLASRTERHSARALDAALAKLAKQAGTSLFIDTSKDPSEFLRLTLSTSHWVVPVHLIRDPRAVAWSGFRRTGTDPLVMARHWARLNRAIAWLRQFTSRYSWQTVRYEDLCADPESIRDRLLAAAGGKASSGPSEVNHSLGGSSGFSLEGSHAIVLDERWKAEMPEALQRRVMLMIGRTARQFGYV
jgi:hypothetical protein